MENEQRNEGNRPTFCWARLEDTVKRELNRDEHLDECRDKLRDLLREYNCDIGWDSETKAVIMWDKDTCRFMWLTGPGMHQMPNAQAQRPEGYADAPCSAFDYRSEFERLLGAVEQAVAARFESHAANGVLQNAVRHYDSVLPNAKVERTQKADKGETT
jgi:hypothetical protein